MAPAKSIEINIFIGRLYLSKLLKLRTLNNLLQILNQIMFNAVLSNFKWKDNSYFGYFRQLKS